MRRHRFFCTKTSDFGSFAFLEISAGMPGMHSTIPTHCHTSRIHLQALLLKGTYYKVHVWPEETVGTTGPSGTLASQQCSPLHGCWGGEPQTLQEILYMGYYKWMAFPLKEVSNSTNQCIQLFNYKRGVPP
jgi:hypothetical protein